MSSHGTECTDTTELRGAWPDVTQT
eukprot:COSAG06_NODE_40742_length_399_cov_0.683333_2_plen_24_part_01